MSTPKAYTAAEARQKLYAAIKTQADYWASLPGKTDKEKMDGLCFSLLVIFDGGTGAMPALNITLAPHPSDEAFHKGRGEQWFAEGMEINLSTQMHEEWCQLK